MDHRELYHYGILGQRWGKRNGPPYPLNQSDRSYAEKKAAKQSSSKKKTYLKTRLYEKNGLRRKK